MEREIDKLADDKKYKATCQMYGFCSKGTIRTGRYIKNNIPYDVSPNQGVDAFFKEVK